jgi:hypothetical protein
MACELRGGTPQTDALPTPADWAKIYLEQLAEKNLRIAEFEVALREWREKFLLTEDGREFVSVPVAAFDRLLTTAR